MDERSQHAGRPIIVTGAHRSGSTWVGRMIGASPSVGYIHEPFNLRHSIGVCGATFDHWFPYITAENESRYHRHVKRTLMFSYNLRKALTTVRSMSEARRIISEFMTFRSYHASGVRPLLKDPIAVFSAEWLASTFGMDVVVLIRHPAAFASSLKRRHWTHPFSHFSEQPLLMRDHLAPFESEVREQARVEHDIIDQASLLWRLIYYVVARYRERHQDWIFVRHEDLSRDPVGGFRALFEHLGLQFSSQVEGAVREHTDPSNPREAPEGGDSLRRHSEANISNWRDRLTAAEIDRLRANVRDVSGSFYSNEEW